jgi:hypothetical protein
MSRIWLGLTGLLLACGDPTGVPGGAIRIEPPGVYRDYWQHVEECSGLVAPFEAVRWYVVFEVKAGSDIIGQRTGDHEIILRSDLWLEEDVVSHEILHELIGGDGGHRRPEWRVCGLQIQHARPPT